VGGKVDGRIMSPMLYLPEYAHCFIPVLALSDGNKFCDKVESLGPNLDHIMCEWIF
jgi:hypothetical protein